MSKDIGDLSQALEKSSIKEGTLVDIDEQSVTTPSTTLPTSSQET